MQFIVISGRSGSGKSAALHAFEDAGYNCIDNLPANFLLELVSNPAESHGKGYAIAVDARTPQSTLLEFPDMLQQINKKGIRCQVLFLDAKTDTLVRRYNETRRKHPLTDSKTTLGEALILESKILEAIAEIAEYSFLTDELTHYDLQNKLRLMWSLGDSQEHQLIFNSFGFKYGPPSHADFVFDVRCLPNPHWDVELRNFTGLDSPVQQFLSEQPRVIDMQASIELFLNNWLTDIFSNNRSYLSIAIGCTGGKHRSVYLAEKLCQKFSHKYPNVQVRHREITC